MGFFCYYAKLLKYQKVVIISGCTYRIGEPITHSQETKVLWTSWGKKHSFIPEERANPEEIEQSIGEYTTIYISLITSYTYDWHTERERHMFAQETYILKPNQFIDQEEMCKENKTFIDCFDLVFAICPSQMRAYPVPSMAGSPKNDWPECIQEKADPSLFLRRRAFFVQFSGACALFCSICPRIVPLNLTDRNTTQTLSDSPCARLVGCRRVSGRSSFR